MGTSTSPDYYIYNFTCISFAFFERDCGIFCLSHQSISPLNSLFKRKPILKISIQKSAKQKIEGYLF